MIYLVVGNKWRITIYSLFVLAPTFFREVDFYSLHTNIEVGIPNRFDNARI